MWNLILINKIEGYYIVMTPNGENHCIDEETYVRFKKEGRIE